MRQSVIQQIYLEKKDLARLGTRGIIIRTAEGNSIQLLAEFDKLQKNNGNTTSRTLEYVVANPGNSAINIAKKLGADSAAVRSALERLVKKNTLAKKEKLFFPVKSANGKS